VLHTRNCAGKRRTTIGRLALRRKTQGFGSRVPSDLAASRRTLIRPPSLACQPATTHAFCVARAPSGCIEEARDSNEAYQQALHHTRDARRSSAYSLRFAGAEFAPSFEEEGADERPESTAAERTLSVIGAVMFQVSDLGFLIE
jgi:hypothetical protein